MNPWAATDWTANHMGPQGACALVSETLRATILRTVRNRDTRILRRVHD